LPATGTTPSTKGRSRVTSLQCPPVRAIASGSPLASVSRWRFEPARARSTRGWPRVEPPKSALMWLESAAPWTSRSHRRRSASPAPPGAVAPRPLPVSTPAGVASRSPPSRSRTRWEDRARRSRYARRRGSRSTPPGRPNAFGPDSGIDVEPQATVAPARPKGRHLCQSAMAPRHLRESTTCRRCSTLSGLDLFLKQVLSLNSPIHHTDPSAPLMRMTS
jgi:hypothetical protein